MIYLSNVLIDIFQKKEMNFDEIIHPKFEKIYLVQGDNENFLYLFLMINSGKLQEFISDLQPEIYSFFNEDYMKRDKIKIKNGFEKNTTAIICTVNDEFNNDIENIEEDPYFFKKQVLNINKMEYEYIESLMPEGNYLNIINHNIIDKHLFTKFLVDDDCRYSLAAKLYEKIPFLNLNTQVIQRKNLDDIIETSIINLSDIHLKMRNFILENEVENFKDIVNNKDNF
ncbi:hypothetical protein VXG46_000715 [Acinetobacter baumannii]|nr:hypothetical protein [Acinetobacter baumannii]EMC7949346.1 hypothetical protein [Acinetobacter baumannii]EMD9691605.1 hypothetical protein [Acinetobacter baumannii]